MKFERGFPIPKHGNGGSLSSVARGMPIPRDSEIGCNQDSCTTITSGGNGDIMADPRKPIPSSTTKEGTLLQKDGMVQNVNDGKPVIPGNPFPHRNGIGESSNSWIPVTPEKVITEKSSTIPDGMQKNTSETDNWQDLLGMYTGLLKEETVDTVKGKLNTSPDEKQGTTLVSYIKTNDPANWKCNHLASIVCSKTSNEAQNKGILLQDTSRRSTSSSTPGSQQTQRFNLNNFIGSGDASKDKPANSTITDSFLFAPITPAKHNDCQLAPENLKSHSEETNGETPPSAVSTTQKQHIVPEDLSKTPHQKTPTRRRKHRPQVIKPQKPKKNPKTVTTPGETRVKRKYVRKKGVNNSETQQKTPGASVGKRKYVRKKRIDNDPVKSCKKKLNFDLDANPQVTEQGSNCYIPLPVVHVPIAKPTHNALNMIARNMNMSPRENGYNTVTVATNLQKIHQPKLISLDERRGIKRQSHAMDSLLLYQKLLLGVAQRAHNRNIFLENHKKIKIQGGFQASSTENPSQMNGMYGNGSVMQLLHCCGQKVNLNCQYQPERLQFHTHVPAKDGFKYGVIAYPATLLDKKQRAYSRWWAAKGEASVDYVAYKLEHLHISDDNRKGVSENELVVYRGSNAIVPFEPIKKRSQRPKVDLDPETDRLWRLLMGKEGTGSEGGETLDKDKEEWWENERRVFRGRADSFIARMHLVQGDRRFSRWKGSVVDSVIGVFLTQNVSDHLSSSAFMALAAKFPVKTSCQDGACERPVQVAEEKDVIKCHENIKESASEDCVAIPIVDEIRSNSEAEDVATGHGETGAQKQESVVLEGIENGAQKQESIILEEIPVKVEENSKEQNDSREAQSGAGANTSKEKKRLAEEERNRAMNWDSLRKEAVSNGEKKEKSNDARDSIDYEAFRHAPINEISDVIKERGMNNLLADRMKDFLNRLVRDHGKIDLEWLRDAPPDKAKDYLLSFRGLGLKSVECVRLLTLHHLAFPVDTNVGRIAVRLGWVPLQPLPESLQLHLLEMYPVLDSIQKYLWPRLCKLDQLTLYELHYQMITFGKVFCTKSKPNCNACPMRAECRHFASAFASARLALPGPEEKKMVTTNAPIPTDPTPNVVITPMPLPQIENDFNKSEKNCEPIIEEPTTPEPEPTEVSLSDIEDHYYEDSDEIPSIKLNMEEFTNSLQNIMQDNKELQENMSKALVALSPNAAYIPTPKLKDVSRLRTEHQVYELPDSHRLLEGFEKREPDDPSPYLLAIWTPGETPNSVQPPERECWGKESGTLCDKKTCFSCNSIKEANSQVVRGTILIPCRTAMRGSFPLNGTYFQVNEMFADHASSLKPIDVPRAWIWNLPRRTVYFGTSVSTIFKGLSTQGIQYCFWKGFVCVRGFDRETRAPRPLMARLHLPASKLIKIKNEGK